MLVNIYEMSRQVKKSTERWVCGFGGVIGEEILEG